MYTLIIVHLTPEVIIRLIATYFNVSLDSLVIDPQQTLSVDINFNQFNVPVISWELVEKFVDDKIPSEQIVRKQLIAIHKKDSLNIKNMFALESKPSMYSVYPPGTLFIVAPEVKPVDGDIVLVKCTRNNTTTLKKLQMDLPDMYLCSITLANNSMRYNNKLHQVIGVVILTLFYSHSATV